METLTQGTETVPGHATAGLSGSVTLGQRLALEAISADKGSQNTEQKQGTAWYKLLQAVNTHDVRPRARRYSTK